MPQLARLSGSLHKRKRGLARRFAREYAAARVEFADIADERIRAYEYLTQKTATHLETLGIAEWNWEQDLGVEGMRRSKTSFVPTRHLKKFIVALAD